MVFIDQHPSINNDYSINRLFASSSVLPDTISVAKKLLLKQAFIVVKTEKNTVKYFAITTEGKLFLDSLNLESYLFKYTMKIDKTGFINSLVRKVIASKSI